MLQIFIGTLGAAVVAACMITGVAAFRGGEIRIAIELVAVGLLLMQRILF